MPLDALPDDVAVVVCESLAAVDAPTTHVRGACAAWRRASDAAVRDDAWLQAHCDALRVRVVSERAKACWMHRRRRAARDDWALPKLRCARCGRPTRGVLTCECHLPRVRAFPWRRTCLGPLAAALAVVVALGVARARTIGRPT